MSRPSPEATDACFFRENELPDLSPGHDRRIPVVLRLLQSGMPGACFDGGEQWMEWMR